jgi:hypothetical protein
MTEPNPIEAMSVESYNLDLAALSSSARVALPADAAHKAMLELQDDEGSFLSLIPSDTSPEMAAVAYRLYGQGLNHGVRAGEEAAWAKLRFLIGAAAIDERPGS